METNSAQVKLVECPRDAMQGLKNFIPSKEKILYLNKLLQVGFDTLDFGSFVSPSAIPQMKDTAEIVDKLDLSVSKTKLLAIVANKRGAEDALQFPQISYLGFPLSVSETFQKLNTNKSASEAFALVEQIQNLCLTKSRTLVVYLSMGFGNPYGDPYHPDYLIEFISKLKKLAVSIICPSDTIGISSEDNIRSLFSTLIPLFPEIEFGAHLHSLPSTAVEKIKSAYDAGCRRFDGALKGMGGCPMAENDLVGNIPTESIYAFLQSKNIKNNIQESQLSQSLEMANTIFGLH